MLRAHALMIIILALVITGALAAAAIARPSAVASVRASPASAEAAGRDPLEVFLYPSSPRSGQPVVIVVTGAPGPLVLSARLSVVPSTNDTSLSLQPLSYTLVYPMLPYPGPGDVYVAAVPGLPAASYTFTVGSGPLAATYYLNVTSYVSFNITYGGSVAYSASYEVTPGSATEYVRPLVGAVVRLDLNDTEALEETYGLSTPGWVAGPSEGVPLLLFCIANSSSQASTLAGYYSTNMGASWSELEEAQDPIMNNVDAAVGQVNSYVSQLNSVLQQLGLPPLPQSYSPLMADDAEVPPVGLGSTVMFMAECSGQRSPYGLYYVVNTSSPVRVLVVDPHVRLWLLARDAGSYVNLFKYYNVSLPAALSNLSLLASEAEEAQFHYWNLVGERLDIYIAMPDQYLGQALSSFRPSAIYLSDLALGLRQVSLLDWDLSTIEGQNGTDLEELISYVEEHHAGLIGSGGTLGDWVVWLSCDDHAEVGPIGQVGDELQDANVVNESVLSTMFGMPLLPVFEYLKNETAQELCRQGYEGLGMALGSTPLLIPLAPWNGTLKLSTLPMSNPQLDEGLPGMFTLELPSVYSQLGYNATTMVGWQLAMPLYLAVAAFRGLNSTWGAGLNYEAQEALARLASEATGASVSAQYLDYPAEGWLLQLARGINYAVITPSYVNLSLPVPGHGLINVSVPVNESALASLLASLVPVRVAFIAPNYEAAVITYDKYFSQDGYRSVYFTMPLEASNQSYAAQLIYNAVMWTLGWSYEPLPRLLGLVVSNGTMAVVRQLTSAGQGVAQGLVLLDEGGRSLLSFQAPEAGVYSVIVVHPLSSSASLYLNGSEAQGAYVGYNVTVFNITVLDPATVTVGLASPGALEALTPAYVDVRLEEPLYQVTFTESGLPSGAAWSVTLNGTTKWSNSSSIAFYVPAGTYEYSVGQVSGYVASPSSGEVSVRPSSPSAAVQVTFTPVRTLTTTTTTTVTETVTRTVNVTQTAPATTTTTVTRTVSATRTVAQTSWVTSTATRTINVTATSTVMATSTNITSITVTVTSTATASTTSTVTASVTVTGAPALAGLYAGVGATIAVAAAAIALALLSRRR